MLMRSGTGSPTARATMVPSWSSITCAPIAAIRSAVPGAAFSTTRRAPGCSTRSPSISAASSPPPVSATPRNVASRKGNRPPPTIRLTPARSSPPGGPAVKATTSTSGTMPAMAFASAAPGPATSTVPRASASPMSAASLTAASASPSTASSGDGDGDGDASPAVRTSSTPWWMGYCSRQLGHPSRPSITRRSSMRSARSTSPCSGPQRGQARMSVSRMYIVFSASHKDRGISRGDAESRRGLDMHLRGSASPRETPSPRRLERILGVLVRRLPYADVDEVLGVGTEKVAHLLEDPARLVLGARLDLGERRQLVDVLVVQPVGHRAEMALGLAEVVRHPPLAHVVVGQPGLHLVAVAVQPL